jgi:hypothetical protein
MPLSSSPEMHLELLQPRRRSTSHNIPEDFSLQQHSRENFTHHNPTTTCHKQNTRSSEVTIGRKKWHELSPVIGCWIEFQFPSLHPHHINWFVSIHVTLQGRCVSFLNCDNSRGGWEVGGCCNTPQYMLLRMYDILHTTENKLQWAQRTL